MNDWIDKAASDILANWPTWEEDAAQLAQQEQDDSRADQRMLECISNRIRWLWANHSKGIECPERDTP